MTTICSVDFPDAALSYLSQVQSVTKQVALRTHYKRSLQYALRSLERQSSGLPESYDGEYQLAQAVVPLYRDALREGVEYRLDKNTQKWGPVRSS